MAELQLVTAKSPKTGDTYTMVILGDQLLMRGPGLTGGLKPDLSGQAIWASRGGASMVEFITGIGADYATNCILPVKTSKAERMHFADHVWPALVKAARNPKRYVEAKPLEDLADRWRNRAAPLAELARRSPTEGLAYSVKADTLRELADELGEVTDG